MPVELDCQNAKLNVFVWFSELFGLKIQGKLVGKKQNVNSINNIHAKLATMEVES